MKHRLSVRLFIASLVLLGAGLAFAGDEPEQQLYVRSRSAALNVEARFDAGTLKTLHRGDGVRVLERNGNWLRVEAGGVVGFVYRLGLSDRAPAGESAVFTETTPSLAPMARRRASSMTSAAAARGLGDDDAARLKGPAEANYGAVEKIESVAHEITDRDVDRFQHAKE